MSSSSINKIKQMKNESHKQRLVYTIVSRITMLDMTDDLCDVLQASEGMIFVTPGMPS